MESHTACYMRGQGVHWIFSLPHIKKPAYLSYPLSDTVLLYLIRKLKSWKHKPDALHLAFRHHKNACSIPEYYKIQGYCSRYKHPGSWSNNAHRPVPPDSQQFPVPISEKSVPENCGLRYFPYEKKNDPNFPALSDDILLSWHHNNRSDYQYRSPELLNLSAKYSLQDSNR